MPLRLRPCLACHETFLHACDAARTSRSLAKHWMLTNRKGSRFKGQECKWRRTHTEGRQRNVCQVGRSYFKRTNPVPSRLDHTLPAKLRASPTVHPTPATAEALPVRWRL